MSGNGQDRASQAYERLRHFIVHGKLAPGARVIETDVAERLGVSRTPVRAALQRLEQEGFIQSDDSAKRWRPSVAPLTEEDAEELLHLIGQLEGLAAWYATQLDDDEHRELVARLREINQELEELSEKGDAVPSDYFQLDADFHWAYVEATAGPRLRGLINSVRPQAERYIRVYVSALLDRIDTSIQEHEEIIQAIEARDGEAAQSAVEGNWRGAAKRMAGIIEQVGERGSW